MKGMRASFPVNSLPSDYEKLPGTSKFESPMTCENDKIDASKRDLWFQL